MSFCRFSGKAEDLLLGRRREKASFAEPARLAEAFDGTEQVLLISAHVLGDEALRLHGNAIWAAEGASVRSLREADEKKVRAIASALLRRTAATSDERPSAAISSL